MIIYELSALGDTESSGSPALCSLRPGRSAALFSVAAVRPGSAAVG